MASDHEADDVVYEYAEIYGRCAGLLGQRIVMLPVQRDEQAGKIDPARNHTHQRHDDVADQRPDDGRECRADIMPITMSTMLPRSAIP